MSKGCTLCGAIYHTKTFCYKNPNNPIPRSKLDIKPKPCEWCGYSTHPSSLCWRNPKRGKGKVSEKPLHCTHCDGFGHIRATCGIRLEFKRLNEVDKKAGRKPINRIGKYNLLWRHTRKRWMVLNPPNHAGYYKCHYCPVMLPKDEMTLDHRESRSRRPELRFVLSNLVPCCGSDNERKGSRSHDEYAHDCPSPPGLVA